MFLIVGLGNPGKEYESTRHNSGFMAVDRIAEKFGVKISRSGFTGKHAKIEIDGKKTVLLKPQIYMNLSGNSVAAAMRYYKCKPSELIVLYDDVDLPLGRLRIRPQGSAGTHNGMKSILSQIQSDAFHRVRIGVSSAGKMDLADYVLSKFSAQEQKELDRVLELAAEAAVEIVRNGAAAAMQKYNGVQGTSK